MLVIESIAVKKAAYPRESALDHRGRLADAATKDLAKRIGDRERAELAEKRAEDERARILAEAEKLRENEREMLAHGDLKVEDLRRAGAWEVRAQGEARALDERVDASEKETADARDKEGAARAEVANRKADVDVLQKDRDRYLDQVRKKNEASEEEAAAEIYRPKKC